ncbi:MAG: RNA 2',3'-cyclic phosphodiesterase [Patescibacteria group bacterium]
MKRRRIFLAINLPDSIKKKLMSFQEKWFDLPVLWTKKDNLHITLVFIGYVSDEEMLEICHLAKEVIGKYNSFEIKLNRICLGPPNRPARMIWVEGQAKNDLARLKDDLEKALLNSSKSGFNQAENRSFKIHITLARIKHQLWQVLPDKPEIDEELNLNFLAESVEVMESHLSRGGAEYAVLESIKLGK